MHTSFFIRSAFVAVSFGCSVSLAAGPAGVKLDGTLGGAAQILAGPNYNISQNLGKLSGGNLYFSFQYFNVGQHEIAEFSTTSRGINNVISRVTGGYSSTIDGEISLQAAYGNPNFFLINPAGVTFTANASVNVPAAFFVTTANYLKFGDGNRFYADPSQTSTISAASPEAFGFLGASRAAVQVLGTFLSAGGNGQFDIAAGNIVVDGEGVGAGIVGLDGNINLTAVGNTHIEVPLAGSVSVNDGTITIENGAVLQTISDGAAPGGAVTLSAGTVTVDGAGFQGTTGLETLTGGAQNAGAITVNAGGDVSILNGVLVASVSTGTGGAQNAGAITVNAGGDISILNGVLVTSVSKGKGAAGSIGITADDGIAKVTNGSIVSVRGTGAASAVTIAAKDILVDDAQLLAQEGNIALTAFGKRGPSADASAASGNIKIRNGSLLQTQSDNTAPGGAIMLTGGSVTVDGEGSVTGVQTDTTTAKSAGAITIDATTGTLSVVNGGLISSLTAPVPADDVPPASYGNAGNVSITAKDVDVEGKGFSGLGAGSSMGILSETDTSGNAGKVEITAGTVTVAQGAGITPVFISAQADAGSGSAGEVDINASETISVLDGGVVTAATGGSGSAGSVHLTAPSLMIQGQGAVGNTLVTADSLRGASGNGGSIEIDVGSLTIDGSGGTSAYAGITSLARAAASGYPGSTGAGGTITINASGAVSIIDGGVIETDTASAKPAGDVDFKAASLSIMGDGYSSKLHGTDISSNSTGAGAAGNVKINVGSLSIVGGDGTGFAGVQAIADSTGSGGQVVLCVSGTANITDGGAIRSNTYASGNAGDVTVTAGTLDINGTGDHSTETAIEADTFGSGKAGAVNVTAQTLSITGVPVNVAVGIESVAEKNSEGAGGEVNVSVAGDAMLSNHGTIHTDSLVDALGKAGQVKVQVGGTLTILSDATISSSTESAGNAGKVNVNAAIINIRGDPADGDTAIQAASSGSGNAGDVSVTTGSLTIDGGGSFAGISSEVSPQGAVPAGAGGRVSVTVAGNLILIDGGLITSTSAGLGPAGDVDITADNITITGGTLPSAIASQSAYNGQAGQIKIHTGDLSIDNGFIDITNLATVNNPTAFKSGKITVFATDISLDEAEISAGSTGNVAASALDINYSRSMTLRGDSELATQANAGNGGRISVAGGGLLVLDQSKITTSVSGKSGNGGDIDISVPLIVMDTAAIQANTAAKHASGGDITIDAAAIIPSFQSFSLGGQRKTFDPTLAGQNFVQAVGAVPGNLDVTLPTLDIGSALLALTGKPAASTPLGRSLCGFTRGSSLSVTGRGGLPASASDPLWIGVDDPDRATAHSSPYRSIDSDDLPVGMLVSDATVRCQ